MIIKKGKRSQLNSQPLVISNHIVSEQERPIDAMKNDHGESLFPKKLFYNGCSAAAHSS